MTPGDRERLQALSRCHVTRNERACLAVLTWEPEKPLKRWEKYYLRRHLMHKYRHQLAAMRRNRRIVSRSPKGREETNEHT